ncbi:MAG: DNA polymerase III subunit psi [Cyclobacteriaceae bacterium]|nr:DNA polymerase III subunit psi [Cyclobacteriaceae bacterium]UYN88248.1 MAG: DNA polymerase III subunit psi [Cyclobacteriaceae bacterium]
MMSLQREAIEQTFTEDLYKIPGRVIILVPQEWSSLSPNEIELLSKILGAVKLKMAQVQILVKEKADMAELLVFNPPVVLSFGSKIAQVNTPYQVSNWNGVHVLEADSLRAFDEAKKKQLWNALRELFNHG